MTTSEAAGAARRMINESKPEGHEESESKEARRWARYREMLWEHLEAAHERHKSDMEAGQGAGAFQETNLVVALGREYFGKADSDA